MFIKYAQGLTRKFLSDLVFLITPGTRKLTILVALVLGTALSACGGGGGSTTPSTKAKAATETEAPPASERTTSAASGANQSPTVQANAICENAKREQSEGFVAFAKQHEQNPDAGQSEKEGLEEVVLEVALPPISTAAGELSEIEAPSKEQREFDALAKSLRKATKEAEADPLSVSANSKRDPFDKASALAIRSGFDGCANLG